MNKERFLNLGVLQCTLPLLLSLTAVIFELAEHVGEGELLDPAFLAETIIFGFMGPIIIALLIAWMREIVSADLDRIQAVGDSDAPSRRSHLCRRSGA